MKTSEIIAQLEAKHPGEPEFIQAVREVLLSIEDIYNQHPEFEKNKIVERLVEPDRIFTFRIPWVDDKGEVQINLGYRVQFNNCLLYTSKERLAVLQANPSSLQQISTSNEASASESSPSSSKGLISRRHMKVDAVKRYPYYFLSLIHI